MCSSKATEPVVLVLFLHDRRLMLGICGPEETEEEHSECSECCEDTESYTSDHEPVFEDHVLPTASPVGIVPTRIVFPVTLETETVPAIDDVAVVI
jgi:hypothetical protein